jgi:heme exporter protein A
MLSVNNLSLERYFEPVFHPVSFTLSAGNMLLVTGANGSGKTTMIRMLAGVLTPSQGSVELQQTEKIYVGHMLAVKDDLSVTENIEFMRKFTGRADVTTDEVVDRVGLRRVAEQLARTLSAGQRKRCALARLLLSDARLWLLDEPYSNLDKEGIEMLDGMLRVHLDSGGACVLTTHGSLRPAGFELQECELISGSVAA